MTTWADGTSTARTAAALEERLTSSVVNLNVRGASPSASAAVNKAVIDQAITDAAASGGVVEWGAGTYTTTGGHLVKSNVKHRGAGQGVTVVKLASSSNTDLFVGDGFGGLTGGTSRTGPSKWGFQDITLDGNKAGNTSGWVLRVYGHQYTMTNFEATNGASGGVWSESGTGGTDMESHWVNWRITNCKGDSLVWRGPNDSMFANGIVFADSSVSPSALGTGITTAGNATSEVFTNVHVWGSYDHTWWFDAPAYCTNCQGEGATIANVVLNTNFGCWIGGQVFGTTDGGEVGFQFGSGTGVARYWRIDTRLHRFTATCKPLYYVDSNSNEVRVQNDASSGCTRLVYGTPGPMDSIITSPAATAGNVLNSDVDYGQDRKEFGYYKLYGSDTYRGVTLAAVEGIDSYIELAESTNVSNASTNCARIQARDNGAGKTQLVVRFPSGAVQVLATEP